MSFAAPWILLALAGLPLLWWLLRITPPTPRRQSFPPTRLLRGLEAVEAVASRTPWWLLALRLAAAGLAVLALARPQFGPAGSLPGTGPVLLVIDNGWAAASDWPRRLAAATRVIDAAGRAGRQVALLATAPDATGAPPAATALLPGDEARRRLAALRPLPWPVDRGAAATALAAWHGKGGAVYLADGIAQGSGWDDFVPALAAIGPVVEITDAPPRARLMLAPRAEAGRLIARIAEVPRPEAREGAVLARSGDGRILARVPFRIAAGAGMAEAAITLPAELRNRLERLEIEGENAAAGVALLDERWRRRPVGLLAQGPGDETPLLGGLFYLRRALGPTAELREGRLADLLGRDLSVLIAPDGTLADPTARAAVARWVERGGMLLRFAGPHLAAPRPEDQPDDLLPVPLLAGDRALGGAMSWSEPARLAPFPADSPFAGLAVPADVTISRQVLAAPTAGLVPASWAGLADGTPLVTAAPRGAGRIVLFHVTANADWSNLPLSGLFPQMLTRLVALSAGAATADVSAPDAPPLAPAEILDGFGLAGPPPPSAAEIPAATLATAEASPRHPPGFYGPAAARRALNLGQRLSPPEAAPPLPGARTGTLEAAQPPHDPAAGLMTAAAVLLLLDLALSLGLRGLLRRGIVPALLLALAAPAAQAADIPPAALQTRLAYVRTGDEALDALARAGLAGLSGQVSRRTAARLGPPDAVTPGRDDLSLYPLLYWPLPPASPPLPATARTALDDFMHQGGILVIDTRDPRVRPGVALQGLDIPPLALLTGSHVLARSFYLLSTFPGRYADGPVWVQRDPDSANDGVSPVVLGGNDWATAWAAPDNSDRQHSLAIRFGINLVIYALTGNYKGDQVHLPTLLQRMAP